MADTKLSELTAATTLDTSDEFYVNDSGTSKRITKGNMQTGADAKFVSGTAGSSGQLGQWNADGDLVGWTLSVDLTADVTGVLPLANGGTGASTASAARTALGVDAAGTDNSTDVTLAGSYDYLTLSGQQITLGQVDLSTDVTGTLPAANGGTGQTSLGAVDAADFGSGAATDGYVLTADGAGGAAWEEAAAGGVTDHGALSGLTDDDHTQYLLVDGSRAMTGYLTTNRVVGSSTNYLDLSDPAAMQLVGGATDYFRVNAGGARFDIKPTTTSVRYESHVSDGASTVAHDFDTLNALSTSGALIQQWSTGGAAKAWIDKDGRGYFEGLDVNPANGSFTGIDAGTGESLALYTNGGLVGAVRNAAGFGLQVNSGNYIGISSGTPGANASNASIGSPSAGVLGVYGVSNSGFGDLYIGDVLKISDGDTVANLPGTPAVGMIARVTDANSPSVGSTVSGGGAAAALVWYNGSNWTVIGI